MQSVRIAVAAAAIIFAAPAAAQSGQKVSFKIGTVAVEAPIPAGYCLPTGDAVAKAQLGVASDPENVTHATLYKCDQMSNPTISDYYLIKTPKNLVDMAMTRDEVIKALTAEMEDPNFSADKLSDEAGSKASKSISEASGSKTNVTTDIRPLGRDQDCAYMGGLVAADTAGTIFSVNVGGCITAAANRLVMVFRYTKGTVPAAAAAILPDARRLAMAIRTK